MTSRWRSRSWPTWSSKTLLISTSRLDNCRPLPSKILSVAVIYLKRTIHYNLNLNDNMSGIREKATTKLGDTAPVLWSNCNQSLPQCPTISSRSMSHMYSMSRDLLVGEITIENVLGVRSSNRESEVSKITGGTIFQWRCHKLFTCISYSGESWRSNLKACNKMLYR